MSRPAIAHAYSDQSASSLLYVTISQLSALGISRSTIKRKLKSKEWKSLREVTGGNKKSERLILVSSLPAELQLNWLRLNNFDSGTEAANLSSTDEIDDDYKKQDRELVKALLRFPDSERPIWIKEVLRLAKIVARYGALEPKRRRHPATGELEFIPTVYALCEEAKCTDLVILSREPHRNYAPSPYTIDGWWRKYQEIGLLTFLRNTRSRLTGKIDRRRAIISTGAVEWINNNWDKFSGPRYLFNAIDEIAKLKKWTIPHESWFYRLWKNIPEVVRVLRLEGQRDYESRLAPYVPRDFSDLQALQVLCGDHSERDVFVLLPDGRTIARPWWTPWYDLRCGLIWGWHLGLVPSSYAAGLAYADGVQNFGAQPPSLPDQGFYSFIYTDLGRTYRSHNWDGKVIAVHEQAMRPDGSFEMLLVQRRVGIIEELNLKHLLSRGYNAKEKPVEEVHNIISGWEQNTFPEYCGRSPNKRPERFLRLLEQHKRFLQGRREASPFITFEEYRSKLAHRILKYNSSPHKRITLGGISIVPLDEYKRLYTVRYEISPETLALILMKPEKRRIGKNGVQMFRPDWFYCNELMSRYKGMDVEVRYKDDDYSRVWIILPNKEVCEAKLITPSPLINPNKQTLTVVAKARAHERKLVREFELIAQSNVRGETIEDRIARQIEIEAAPTDESVNVPAVMPQSIRLDIGVSELGSKLPEVSATDVAATEIDNSIFSQTTSSSINEFDDE